MKRSIRQCDKCKKLNNAGVSLIELIVAILILAVIVAPLMQMFTSASKANAVNTKNVNADTVAQNIMEAVKAYGIVNTSDAIHNVENGSSSKCFGLQVGAGTKAGACSGKDKAGHPVSYSSDRDATTGDYIMNMSSYEYHLDSITEGTGVYDVDIEFNAVGAYETRNEVPQYSLSLFDKNGTVVIDPINKKDSEYIDAQAILSFAQNCKAFCDSYNFYVDQYNSEHEDHPIAKRPEESVETIAAKILAQKKIKRTLIFKYDKDLGSGKYRLTASYIYKFTAGPDYEYSDVDLEYKEICFDDLSDDITKSIYVIYTPFPYMTKAAFGAEENPVYEPGRLSEVDKIDFAQENIIFENNVFDAKPEVFISVQYNSAKVGDTGLGKIDNSVSGSFASEVTFYSQAELKTPGTKYNPPGEGGKGVNDFTIIKTLDPEHIHKNHIVNVTVTVTSKDGDVSRTVVSTIEQ